MRVCSLVVCKAFDFFLLLLWCYDVCVCECEKEIEACSKAVWLMTVIGGLYTESPPILVLCN